MTKKQSKSKLRKRMIVFMPICLVIIAGVFTAIGNYWVQIAGKYQEKEELNSRMISLREKEAELKVDVNKLEDPDYVARYAREKYMYSKDGELIIRLPEDE